VSRGSAWLLGVGVVLLVVAIVGWVWSESVIPPAVFTGQGVLCLVVALVLELKRPRERPLPLPDLSYSTLALGIGAALMLNGVAFGLWLVLIGAGLAAAGIGGLVRELLAGWRAAR
jgi:hypothetical protein